MTPVFLAYTACELIRRRSVYHVNSHYNDQYYTNILILITRIALKSSGSANSKINAGPSSSPDKSLAMQPRPGHHNSELPVCINTRLSNVHSLQGVCLMTLINCIFIATSMYSLRIVLHTLSLSSCATVMW